MYQDQTATDDWLLIIMKIAGKKTLKGVISVCSSKKDIRRLVARLLLVATRNPERLPDPDSNSGTMLSGLWNWYEENHEDFLYSCDN